MPEKAKRFYLCNLIPLWQIDERDMDVDWPVYHAYFGDLIPMKADVQRRKIRWTTGDGVTADPDLKIRFEIHESDFLLSGGRNDHMNTFSSHADFGDDVIHRPIRIVDDVDKIPEDDQRKFIFIHWIEANEQSLTVTAPDGTSSTTTEQIPDTLQVRCFWTVVNPEGGDVKGNPEFYYDVYIEGKLEDGDEVELHERSDHELEGFAWHVADKARKGRVTPLVDGEYAFLKMLQLLDGAQHSIHILNWKIDPQATLLIEPEFQADYLQVPGLDPASYAALIARCKPRVTGVTIDDNAVFYCTSNGNVMAAIADGSASPVTMVQHFNDPTNIDLPSGIHVLNRAGGAFQVLFLDQLRSRLLLYFIVPRDQLGQLGPGVFVARFAPNRAIPVFEQKPTLPFVMGDPDLLGGIMVLAGAGNPSYSEGGLVETQGRVLQPKSAMNRPTGITVAQATVFITDTGNHCVRRIEHFDPADLDTVLRTNPMTLTTLAGQPASPGNADGAGGAARFNAPTGIVWDEAKSRLIVADTGNRRLCAVSPTTAAVTTLAVTKIDGVAAPLGEVVGVAIDPASNILFVSERDRHRILAVDLATLEATTLAGSRTGVAGYQDGAAAAALFRRPEGLSFANGLLAVADADNHVARIIEVGPGTVRTIGSATAAQAHDVPVVLADVLRRKAAAGVAVRILLDGAGSGINRALVDDISGKQTEQDFRFFDHRIQAFVQNHMQVLRKRAVASYHEKMMVVDGKAGIAGGIDFAPDKNDGILHDRDHRDSLFWHDVAVLVEGPAAFGLEEAFNRRWQMAREEIGKDEHASVKPDALQPVDRTDAAVQDDEAEAVRTFDPTPLVGFLVNLRRDEVKEILESYKRAILAARHYVYLEHQYIYYPEIGEYCAEAMKDNPHLQVIWLIPFFTEETSDPTQDQLVLIKRNQLATSITGMSQFLATSQLQKQFAWHGFFRHHEMVEKLRGIDRNRFGVFSIQKLFTPTGDSDDLRIAQIYPHSKMILCDDRVFSIGSANANGRGFTKDGELNISARAPAAAKALRQRIWGEHLGYLGVAIVTAAGALIPVNGHHLQPGDTVMLKHPDLGPEVAKKVAAVDAAIGAVQFEDGPLDPNLRRVFWRDPTLADLPLDGSVAFWRRSAHSLDTFRKVKGVHATTNAAGDLIVPGNLATAGDKIAFGQRLLRLNDEGSAKLPEPEDIQPLVSGLLEVDKVTGDAITLKPIMEIVPDTGEVLSMAPGATKALRPFVVRLVDRPAAGQARLELKLMPNQKEVPFDYTVSWLMRQSGGRRAVRAWEIDPPEGIEYAGPASTLLSPWMNIPLIGIPWFFIDFNPDEQARLEVPGRDIRVV